MAFTHGTATRVLVNTRHVSSTISGWTVSHTRSMGEVTAVTDGGARFVPGLMAGSLALRGPQDSTGQQLHAEIAAAKGVDNSLLATVCPYGTALGAFAMSILADISDHTIDGAVTDAVGYTMTASADESVDMGFLVHGLTAETADANAASVDRGAGSTSTGGAVAVLHVTAYSGLTNLIVKVQHSTDNSSWSDLITFTTATGLTAERRFLAAGTTVNRYVRAVTDVTGAGSATFAVAFHPR